LPEQAAGQRKRDAGQQVQPDQPAELRLVGAKRGRQQRCDRGDGPELEAHRGTRQRERDQALPTWAHGSSRGRRMNG